MAASSQDALIAATLELMLRDGYAATGINDSCSKAGVSKGAFYHSFPSKEAIALSTLEAFYRQGMGAIAAVDVSDVPPDERIIAFMNRVAELGPYLWEKGCLIGGLANEMALSSDALQTKVAAQFDKFAEVVAELAEPFVESLESPVITAAEIGEEFLVVVEGAIVLSRAHRDPQRIKAALKRFALHLRTLKKA